MSGSSYGSGSDEGFYELIARQDGSANLRYIDYASAREIYLCAAPNCTHDNESCPSWLADPACTPLVVGDRLLLFYPYPSATAGRPMQILKAGLDGSDRQTLIEFDASESCRSLVSANDHLLVMLVTRTDDTGADVEQGLVSVNLDTGERSSFYTVPEGMSPQFLGMTESGYCILYTVQETLSDEDFPDTEWSENRDKILSSRVHHWTAVPLGGGRGREIFQAAGDLQCMVADDGIYVFNVNTQELRRVTVPDGREETVAALPPQENWQPYSAVFDRKVGDWLLFSVSYYTDEINEETGNPPCHRPELRGQYRHRRTAAAADPVRLLWFLPRLHRAGPHRHRPVSADQQPWRRPDALRLPVRHYPPSRITWIPTPPPCAR